MKAGAALTVFQSETVASHRLKTPCPHIPNWYILTVVEIIGVGMLRKFQQKQSQSRPCLNHWIQVVEKAQWSKLPDVKVTFNSADYVPPYVVFDLCGNKYRLAALVDFETGIVQVEDIMTHPEYDRWSKRRQK
jgi:mRNA interferase HigB